MRFLNLNYCRRQHIPSRLGGGSSRHLVFWDQLHNWANPRARYASTGPEILAEFRDLAMVVGSLGSGGSMTGVAEYMREFAPQVKIAVVESAPGSRIPGTGSFLEGDYVTPFIQRARERRYFDFTVRVTEAQAAVMSRLLLARGVFGGLQTGGVVHAA
jgi:cysteine synthase A